MRGILARGAWLVAAAGPLCASAGAQVTFIVTDEARLATAQSPIYLASDEVGWNPGDVAMKLSPRSDGAWQITIPAPADGTLSFKFTRGSWDRVEVDTDLQDIANRALGPADLAGTGPTTLRLTVEAWADQRQGAAPAPGADRYQPVAATGRVQRLEVRGGGGPAAGMVRDALVWTPPGYDDPANAGARYPALYLMDGQNLFEHTGSIPAEWRVDETATRLIEAGLIEPVIIVGVPHAGSARAAEYLPAPAYGVEAPAGDAFVAFLSETVVPRVDRTFRTRTDGSERHIGGASLGAIISLHAAVQRSDLFGGMLLESPSPMAQALAPWLDALGQHSAWPNRAYVGVGDSEGDGASRARVTSAAEQIARALEQRGAQTRLVFEAGGEHDERAWARRLPEAMQFLLGPSDQ